MRVTVILKDFTEQFYLGAGESIKGFLHKSHHEKFEQCKKLAAEKRASMKIGTGNFRDQVELNQMLRGGNGIDFALEPRKGYKLATFTISSP